MTIYRLGGDGAPLVPSGVGGVFYWKDSEMKNWKLTAVLISGILYVGVGAGCATLLPFLSKFAAPLASVFLGGDSDDKEEETKDEEAQEE